MKVPKKIKNQSAVLLGKLSAEKRKKLGWGSKEYSELSKKRKKKL